MGVSCQTIRGYPSDLLHSSLLFIYIRCAGGPTHGGDCGAAGFLALALCPDMRQPGVFKFSLGWCACGFPSCLPRRSPLTPTHHTPTPLFVFMHHHRTFPTAYSSARHHVGSTRVKVPCFLMDNPSTHFQEQLPCLYTTTTPYHHTISATQTLAGLHSEVKRLREAEHLLQRQIHRYRSSLEEVQTVLYAKINKANELQNFMAPISRLPNEMLLAIFEEVVACQDPGIEGRTEFTISKVSRRWRELAIHSPRLWRRVFITPRVTPCMLEVYKTRGSRALDIEIWGWKDRRDFQRFDAALEKMLDSASRWRSLSISCVCDSHLSHLTLKLSNVGHFSGLKHFTFRALRPGQTCSISFLMENGTPVHPPSPNQTSSPCMLKSLDAENFTLTGDLGSIPTRATQNFARLSSLTLRRYSNDTRSFRITIDFSAFRAMLSAIPNLTTLVLHGQPLRFRTDPIGGLHGQGDTHGGGGIGGSVSAIANAATVSLPHLHTLVLHPGVLKPRYLQHTISAIHAPALRQFELVFPDSKLSGQNVVERLFVDASPSVALSTSSSYASYAPPSSAMEEHLRRRRPRFPRVETLVLNNASSAGTALAFVHAFPCVTQLTLGGVDVGFFPLALRTSTGPNVGVEPRMGTSAGIGMGAGVGVGVGVGAGMGVDPAPKSGLGAAPYDHTPTPTRTPWPRLATLTLRQPRTDALRTVLDWLHHDAMRSRTTPPTLVVQASLDRQDVRCFAQCARGYTRVELMGIQDFAAGVI